MCLFSINNINCNPPEETGWKTPTTSIQPTKLLLGVGNEARAGLGGLGPAKRVHQDISVKEYSQQAAEATRQVLQTHIDTRIHIFNLTYSNKKTHKSYFLSAPSQTSSLQVFHHLSSSDSCDQPRDDFYSANHL